MTLPRLPAQVPAQRLIEEYLALSGHGADTMLHPEINTALASETARSIRPPRNEDSLGGHCRRACNAPYRRAGIHVSGSPSFCMHQGHLVKLRQTHGHY